VIRLIGVCLRDARGTEVDTACAVLDQFYQRKNLIFKVEGVLCGIKLLIQWFL